MNVQTIFDKMIDYNVYSEKAGGFQAMCYALRYSYNDGIINREEYELAISEVKDYLGAFGSLGGMLDFREQPWEFSDRLAIYKDWENRPKFK